MTAPIHDLVREHYAKSALAVRDASGCVENAACCGMPNYSTEELASLPEAAALASLGCGNPLMVADLREGERVLDLGSGGGIDVLLSARRVGPTGRAFGLDMTDEMLALAQRNTIEAGATNVEFLKGEIEAIPLPANSIDVVISNCVINLAADKTAVFREIARVLRPGGRLGVSDIVADDALTAAERAERGSYVGCIAGALSFREYEAGLRDAGLEDISITPTHEETAGMSSAIIRARKAELTPGAQPSTGGELIDLEMTIAAGGRARRNEPVPDPIRVLFVCTHNSARSQLAEALLTRYGGADFEVRSAGTEATRVNPLAIRVLAEIGIDWSSARSKAITEFLDERFDYVITVCDRARESCPVFPGPTNTLHWGLDDPSDVDGTDEEKLAAFRRTEQDVAGRLRPFVEVALRAAGRTPRPSLAG